MAYSAVTGRMWPKFNSLKVVCVSLLPASLKRIGTMQPRKSGGIVFRRSSAANSVVSSQTLPKLEIIQAIFKACSFHVQVPKGSDKKERIRKWRHHFPHYKSVQIFFRRSRTANSVIHDRIWLIFFLTHPSSYVYHFYLHVLKANPFKTAEKR